MKTPITYYGGKQTLASLILALIPEHNLYGEPFFGGGAIFFAKPKSAVEVINDTNQFVVNFYQQCKTNFRPLQELIRATLHSRKLHEQAKVMYDHPELFSPLQKA
jgi:DNA adenine methylase